MSRLSSRLYSLYFRYPYIRQYIWSILGIITVSVLITGTFISTRVSTFPVGWEKSFPVSPLGITTKNIRMAARGNFIAVVFEGAEKKVHRIYVSLSFDAGKTFIDPVVIAQVAPDIDHYPSVAISGNGHLAVAWQNLLEDDFNTRLFYSISPDMGASWSTPVRIFLPSEMELLPQIFYDDKNTIHLFYHGFYRNLFNLFHIASTDEKTFDPPESLANVSNIRGAFFPAVYLSGNTFFLVWQGKGELFGVLTDDLYFIKSTNFGRSWSSSRKITSSTANDAEPSLLLYGDTLYCVYQNNEEKSWSIKMLRGYDFGSRWDNRPVTVSSTNANCYSPRVLPARNDELVVIWYDTRDVKPLVVARKFIIPERKFSPESILSRPKAASRNPVAVSINGRIIAMWEEESRIVANYSDVYVEPPAVFSRTHPENAWSRFSGALMEWKEAPDESGIAGFAVIVNRIPDFIPAVQNVDAKVNSYRIPELEDGVSYFHIRAIDGSGNYSRTMHYRLQVSRTPLPMPVVVSPTHPEAKAVPSRSPVFRWAIDEKERLKGFMYSIAKDTLKKPSTFTTGFEIKIDDLADGRYFFTVAAVDKTNTMSRAASYEIIVNRAEELERHDYERIAKGLEITPEAGMAKVVLPSVEMNFPFDPARPWGKNSFNALIVPKNIPAGAVTGYSVVVSEGSIIPPEKVNFKTNIISLSNLKNGRYFIGARARYYLLVNGRKVYYWTRPMVKSFAIQYREEPSAIVAYTEGVIRRLARYRMPVSISLLGAVLSIVTIGFGSRVSFFARLLQFRVRNLIRMLF